MDLLAHMAYGATLGSRTGFAGGRAGNGRRPWIADRTVWIAALFGALPDVVSMGPAYLARHGAGDAGRFFTEFTGRDLVCYWTFHSLVVSLAVSALLWKFRPSLFAPSLAWALHVAMDALTHPAGKFRTPLFYPLSTWGIDGVRWWAHPALIAGYWLALPLLWYALHRGRRRGGR